MPVTPPALPSTAPPRSILITILAWLAMAAGALGSIISFFAVLMVSTAHYGNQSDPVGFVTVVFGPAMLFAAGLGMLRRRPWGYFLSLLLVLAFVASCVWDLLTQPLAPTTTRSVSPSGVPTTTFRSGSSRSIMPLAISLGFIGYLLLPPVRREVGL